ncbi:MAG TPA: DNA polymerase III subunit beta [candidate division Zixibacteria bacterium]|nr:DNA polymerase III subunit beta [candidate division Zixibacteria bacterium]
MKFSIPKSTLVGYLQSVLQVTPTKPALPILSNIMLEALDKKLKISATDLDVSITATLPCEVAKKGVTAAPARILSDIVRELPESDINFDLTGSRLELKVPNGSYKIATVSVEDYPTLPAVNTKKQINLAGKQLVEMIKHSVFACSTDETRPALNGALWQTRGERMVMVATDGHRLARVSAENSALKGQHDDIIVPPKALNLITKLVGESDQEVGVIFGDNNLSFNLGDITLTTRLIEGPYPNYEQVIPQNNSKRLQVSRTELAAAVRRVAILSSALTNQVRFGVSGSKLKLSSANTDVGGEAQETLACDFQGDEIELGYKAAYVQDILTRIDDEEVIFELESPISAGIVYGAKSDKNDFLCLIMPLRLAE